MGLGREIFITISADPEAVGPKKDPARHKPKKTSNSFLIEHLLGAENGFR